MMVVPNRIELDTRRVAQKICAKEDAKSKWRNLWWLPPVKLIEFASVECRHNDDWNFTAPLSHSSWTLPPLNFEWSERKSSFMYFY